MRFRSLLDEVVNGRELTTREALDLFAEKDPAHRHAVFHAANMVNEELNRGIVTYVANRNVNFTNVCEKQCAFCAYYRRPESGESYTLSHREVLDRIAGTPGVTEVCMQGGLNPEISLDWILELLRGIRAGFPDVHIHAFSPMELDYYARRAGVSLDEEIESLKEAGWGSLCGTAAEILDDSIRAEICPDKISSARWRTIVETVHEHDVMSSATIMFGHVERPEHVVRHIEVIRDIQKKTRGFTEFIPLPFVPYATQLGRQRGIDRMVSKEDCFMLYAVSRLFFAETIRNVQVSWVKLGLDAAVESLAVGVNDFGGTLIEENVTRLAGGREGQMLSVDEIVRAVRRVGRIPRQRTTLYELLPV
jgi:7,8-didemethyl-8-hydroxy-5-deazariboflavin synthase CofH subunit